MATFAPPVTTTVPPTLPEGDPEQEGSAYRLFRYYRSRPEGVNVYIYRTGSDAAIAFGRVTEEDPVAVYDDTGTVISDGWEDIELVAWGGHAPITVTANQAAALIAAGYVVS